MRFSILDRAHCTKGQSESETLHNVIEHARHAEALGFRRFLSAEHHGVPGIPGSQPAVLATAVASATSTIRVGTGGIMLPNHSPLVVAEQIGVLEALFPGRIDIGLGNSVGFTKPVREALRQGDPLQEKARYQQDLEELLGYLEGSAAVTARPFNNARTPLWLLAGFKSLMVAAKLGLNVIVGGPALNAGRHVGIEQYRREFRGENPRVIIALDVAVADSEPAARDLLLPQLYSLVVARRRGSFEHLPRVEDLGELSAKEKQRVQEGLDAAVYGTATQVAEQLQRIGAATGVEKFLITAGMSDLEGRARSEELLAEIASDVANTTGSAHA